MENGSTLRYATVFDFSTSATQRQPIPKPILYHPFEGHLAGKLIGSILSKARLNQNFFIPTCKRQSCAKTNQNFPFKGRPYEESTRLILSKARYCYFF
ncbi:MAG: hypothetical protein ACYC25_00700 [Paludibacter sp.]